MDTRLCRAKKRPRKKKLLCQSRPAVLASEPKGRREAPPDGGQQAAEELGKERPRQLLGLDKAFFSPRGEKRVDYWHYKALYNAWCPERCLLKQIIIFKHQCIPL